MFISLLKCMFDMPMFMWNAILVGKRDKKLPSICTKSMCGSACDVSSFTLLSDGLDSRSWSDYEENVQALIHRYVEISKDLIFTN